MNNDAMQAVAPTSQELGSAARSPGVVSDHAGPAKALKLRYLWLAIFVGLAAVSSLGRVNGARMFGWGLGMAIAAAIVSIPFGALLQLVARRLWKVALSYKEAYTMYFVGAVVGLLPPFAADALLAASLFYPSAYGIGFVASTTFVPPLCWASSHTSGGERVGLKRALLAFVILAPLGFALGLVWGRWVAS